MLMLAFHNVPITAFTERAPESQGTIRSSREAQWVDWENQVVARHCRGGSHEIGHPARIAAGRELLRLWRGRSGHRFADVSMRYLPPLMWRLETSSVRRLHPGFCIGPPSRPYFSCLVQDAQVPSHLAVQA